MRPKKKKVVRELTQYQLDRQVYAAFSDRAWRRYHAAKDGVMLPWEDPTRVWEDDDASE